MQDNREEFTVNEQMLLYSEVGGFCPVCGDVLYHTKNGKIFKTFEIAHIYPANPRPEEVELLKNEERLSQDVNNLNNVIAVCKKCHGIFDKPRTIEEYREWFKNKKLLIQNATIKNTYYLFNIEDEIRVVLHKLKFSDGDTTKLSYSALKIKEKSNETLPYIIQKKITDDALDYYDFIKNIFIEIDKSISNKFDTMATQVKSFYHKCMQTEQSQEYVYNTIVEWLFEKTDKYSKRACEIVVAFFIQNCEVFS